MKKSSLTVDRKEALISRHEKCLDNRNLRGQIR
jgi:hypothetical protein